MRALAFFVICLAVQPTSAPMPPLPEGLAPVSADETAEQTLRGRLSPAEAQRCLETVRGALASFAALTDVVRDKLPAAKLKEIGFCERDMQTIGFRNSVVGLDGALRLQDWQIKRLVYELALERAKRGGVSEQYVSSARQAFMATDVAFRESWRGFGFGD